MQKAHSNIEWENYPSIDTPINEQNLNKMEKSIDAIDDRVIALDTTKFNVSDAQTLIKGISFNYNTGVMTITYYNGSTATINTGLAQVAVNFEFDEETQTLYIVKADGSRQPVDLSAFITDYEFIDSDTVAFSSDTSGKVKAIVKEGSIEEKHLRPDYLADIKVEAGKAQASASSAAQSAGESEQSANLSKSYAVGTGGQVRPDDGTDNAKAYSESSKESADTAAEYLTKVEKAGEDAVEAIQNALDIDAPKFVMDLSTGHLMYSGVRFVFNVNNNGHLEWGLAV